MVSPKNEQTNQGVPANIIIDTETPNGYRHVFGIHLSQGFKGGIEKIKTTLPQVFKSVVQFVDPETGESEKGPKFDQTTQQVKGKNVQDILPPGIKHQPPLEDDMPYEPRDRYQENTNMSEISKFRNLIDECIKEVKMEKNPRFALRESLRNVVKHVLNEMAANDTPSKKEDKEETEKIQKGYAKKGNERLDKDNDKLQKELETIVNGIDSTWEVYWDDKGDLNVRAHNLLQVRIVTKFENNFDVKAMVKLVDRVYAIGLTWEQVKNFIKANFGSLKKTTKVDDAKKKSMDHLEDREVIKKDAGPESQKITPRYISPDKPHVKDTKKDDKDFNEPQTKRDEDMPDQPMKQVTEPGKDPEGKNKNIKKTEKVKPPKHDKSPTNLRPAYKETPTLRKKKA